MSRKLTNLTAEELKAEMSIAGSPDKIMKIFDAVWEEIRMKVDWTNPAEIINIHFALRRIEAEIKLNLKRLENRTGQKYKL